MQKCILENRRKHNMDQEKVIVIDFGGQYNQLVARRVRECNVYCEIYSYRTDIEQIQSTSVFACYICLLKFPTDSCCTSRE